MKLNEPGRQELQQWNSRQQAKHAKLYIDLLQAINREYLVALDSQQSGP